MKKTTTRRPRQTRQPRRPKGSSSRPWVVLLCLIALCIGAYWLAGDKDTGRETSSDRQMEQIETVRDDGKDAVYTDTSQELSDAIAAWLKEQGADVQELKREERSEDRQATGGAIYWTTRSTAVTPSEPFSREKLEKFLQKSGGKASIYRVTQTKLDGKDAVEYDIAYFDTLDGDPLYLVTDKLYVLPVQEKGGLVKNIKDIFTESSSPDDEKKQQAETKKAVTESKPEQTEPKQSHPAQVQGRLAIVIDDCGVDLDTLSRMNSIPVPLTYAVMPYKAHTAEAAASGYSAGRKIFVHMPMQPLNTTSSEEIFIGGDMSDSKIQATANEILDQVPYAVGMNNHQGSMATADERIMKSVMSVMRQRGLAFLDSRTNSASVGEQTASAMGVMTGRNNLFIDNDSDVASIKERLRQSGDMAIRNGSAVVIGHCRPNTAQALSEMVDELHAKGVDIVFVTDLMS